MKKLFNLSLIVLTAFMFTGCISFKKIVPSKPQSPDEMEFSDLVWDKGGINGANAKLTTAIVGNANFGPNGLTYKWKENDLAVWGYAKTQADGRTCVFYKKNGKWHGGFFEWISTSRTSRDWKNVKGKYKGWNWNDIPDGADGAFLIMSRDGSKRTNVLKTKWKKQ